MFIQTSCTHHAGFNKATPTHKFPFTHCGLAKLDRHLLWLVWAKTINDWISIFKVSPDNFFTLFSWLLSATNVGPFYLLTDGGLPDIQNIETFGSLSDILSVDIIGRCLASSAGNYNHD